MGQELIDQMDMSRKKDAAGIFMEEALIKNIG